MWKHYEFTENIMKKLLTISAIVLVLALLFSFSCCQLLDLTQTPPEDLTDPTQQMAEGPSADIGELPTEESSDPPVQEPSEEPTEEETIYDPRPHPSDIQAEQDRQDAQQDRDEQNRQEQDRNEQPDRDEQPEQDEQESTETQPVQEDEEDETQSSMSGSYYNTKDEVALYIHLYGCLPDNYITKSEGKRLYGSYKNIPSNMNIGGDRFGNREGLLPAGHTYYECDIGTTGGRNRGAKRIVFSTDGLIYYTDDHYASFTLLYGEP